MNATDKLRKQASVKTLGSPYRDRGHRPTYAIPDCLGDFAVVDGELYAIELGGARKCCEPWFTLVPPSGETAE